MHVKVVTFYPLRVSSNPISTLLPSFFANNKPLLPRDCIAWESK